jgi:hypothetical protein
MVMNLTQSGSSVSGTVTLTGQRVEGTSHQEEVGRVSTFPVSGTVSGSTLTLNWGKTNIALQVSGSSMTGSFTYTQPVDLKYTYSFNLNRVR